jgi:hypothetical protein
MTKKVKQELLDKFQSLETVEELLAKFCDQRSNSEIQELLANMQQLVIEIGTIIEAIESEGLAIIHLLEEYCEMLWQYSTVEQKEQALQISDNIKKSHGIIIRELQKDLVTKTEVVFFPYKASMWDSLESVWLAAKDKPEFDVYVVPIPYFDKNSDGSYREMHDEGKEYPEYVPITDWKKYNIELRMPDVAFIHNPYDEANNVTSVHPDFYTKKLKKAVSQVVYIPYFIYGDNIYEDFCILPGTIYADKVIVQSDAVRDVYFRCFSQWVKENRLELLYNEETINTKFLALGSPKADKVIHSKKEDFVLPQSWTPKLRGKKSVLYNTGISGLLNGNEQQLKKIEDVIACFKNREDVVLWWRPHPLNEGACISMRPQLLEKYNKIVENYKKEDFGIYDNTPDLYRALTYTDMYYGDDSSLVQLCGIQGKPIMMQNIQVLLETSKEEDKTVYFYDCAYENETIWFVAGCYNALYQMDIESGKIIFLGTIPNEDELGSTLYECILKVEDNLWMIPAKATEIACYNLKEKRFSKIKLEDGKVSKSEKFRGAHIYGNCIYMIPWKYEEIVCLDLITNSISRISGVSDVRESCIVGDCIYMPINDSNKIKVYNMDKGKLTEYKIGEGVYRFSYILYKDNKFWLIPRGTGGEVVCWDKENNSIRTYGNYPVDFKHSLMFRAAICKDEYIWLLPEMGNMMIRMHCSDGTMEGFHVANNDKYYCSFVKDLPDGFLTTTAVGAKYTTLMKINTKGKVVYRQKCVVEEKPNFNLGQILTLNRNANYKMAQEYLIWENAEVHLKNMLDDLSSDRIIQEEEKNKYRELFNNIETKAGAIILENITKS